MGEPTPKSHATWKYRRALLKTAYQAYTQSLASAHAPSWSRICCVSDRAAKRIERVPRAWRFRALKLDILAFERHYRHGAPSRKDSNVPLAAAATALAAVGAGLVAYSARRTALETDTANEVNSDRPR